MFTHMAQKTDWNPLLRDEFAKPYWSDLMAFVKAERDAHQVFPPHDQVFAALHLTSYERARVVILGQDPYHGPGQAHGLCFSVQRGVKPPPSLVNMYKELASDLGCTPPAHGNLEHWAQQGVLMLNTSLTVRAHEAASHSRPVNDSGEGWETFTNRVIELVSEKTTPVVFLLWGAHARRKKALIGSHHVIIESPHPSPLSAHRGFFGSRPFSQANTALSAAGLDPIDWQLPD